MKYLHEEKPLIEIDGWNIDAVPFDNVSVAVELNEESQVSSWTKTGLPVD